MGKNNPKGHIQVINYIIKFDKKKEVKLIHVKQFMKEMKSNWIFQC